MAWVIWNDAGDLNAVGNPEWCDDGGDGRQGKGNSYGADENLARR